MQPNDYAKLLDEQEDSYWGELALQADKETSLGAEETMNFLNSIECNDNNT